MERIHSFGFPSRIQTIVVKVGPSSASRLPTLGPSTVIGSLSLGLLRMARYRSTILVKIQPLTKTRWSVLLLMAGRHG